MPLRWKVMAITTTAVFMTFLDVTVVNIAFPAMQKSLPSATLADLSWVINAYNVAVASLLLPGGQIADRFGRRRVFALGLSVFLAGSAACGFAPGVWTLVAARVLQGMGAAVLVPTSLGLVLPQFERSQQAFATSVWAASGAIASAAGPTIGGALVTWSGWRAVFLINIPIGLAVLAGLRLVPEQRAAAGLARKLELRGTALVALGTGLLALGVVRAPDWGWGGTRTLACWAAGLAAAAGAVAVNHRSEAPILDGRLLRVRSFAFGSLGTFVFSMGFFAVLLCNILFLTDVWHYSELRAGLAVTPAPLLAAAVAAPAGRRVDRVGARGLALAGLFAFGAGCLVYANIVQLQPSYVSHFLPAVALTGVGVGLTVSSLQSATIQDLRTGELATGVAAVSVVRQLGGILGVAILIAVLRRVDVLDPVGAFRQSWTLAAGASGVALLAAVGLPSRRALASRADPDLFAVQEGPVTGEGWV